LLPALPGALSRLSLLLLAGLLPAALLAATLLLATLLLLARLLLRILIHGVSFRCQCSPAAAQITRVPEPPFPPPSRRKQAEPPAPERVRSGTGTNKGAIQMGRYLLLWLLGIPLPLLLLIWVFGGLH
jgi:hypothetical protein